MAKTAVPPEWDPNLNAEFTYKRKEGGELTVYAIDKKDAIRTLREHGIPVSDEKLVFRTGKYLKEHLAVGELKKEPIR